MRNIPSLVLPSTISGINSLDSEGKASTVLGGVLGSSSVNLVCITDRNSNKVTTLVLQVDTAVGEAEASVVHDLAASAAVRDGVAERSILSNVCALAAGDLDAEGEGLVAADKVCVFAFGAVRDGGVGTVGRGVLVDPEGVAVCVDGREVNRRAGVDGQAAEGTTSGASGGNGKGREDCGEGGEDGRGLHVDVCERVLGCVFVVEVENLS